MKFAQLDGRRVAVWGYGREGHAALAALRRHLPGQPLTLFCSAREAASLPAASGVHARMQAPDAQALSAFDYVVKSPGISIYKPEIVAAQTQGTVFTSGTALWFGENPDARVIGITGTKGKSTTAALAAHLARAAGLRTALAGNIGLPLLALDGQRADVWVVELSSFQTGEAGPLEVGVVLNLHEEHLDWHGTRERYFADKLKLADVSRTLLVNATHPHLLELTANHPHRITFGDFTGWHIAAHTLPGDASSTHRHPPQASFRRRRESSNPVVARGQDRVRGNDEGELRGETAASPAAICRGEAAVAPVSVLPVPGQHNALNVCAALAVLEHVGVDVGAVIPELATFRPLPHRLQRLGRRGGFDWINDSISTAPQAVVAALDSLAGRRITVILGGHDRGLDWSTFAESIARRADLQVIIQGANGPRIAAAIRAVDARHRTHEAATLDAAVAIARTVSQSGDAIVLSPGAPSFDQFHDYTERGCRFADLAGFDDVRLGGIAGLGIH